MEATSQNSQKSGLCLEVRTSKRSRNGEKGRASVPGGGGLGSIVWPSGAAVPKPGVPAHGTSQCTLLCPQDTLNWASDTGNGKTLVNMGVTAAPWGK